MNAKQFFALALVAMISLPALSFAVANYVELPVDFIASIMEYATQLFTDINLLVILAIGLPLGFWIIRKVVALVRVR